MNVQTLLKQAQKMQKELAKAEAELKSKTYSASVGGGVVKVDVSGECKITNLEIKDSIITKEDKEALQDMVIMAVNDALSQMNSDKEKTMNEMTGGVKMPGVF